MIKKITMYELTCCRCGGKWVSKTQDPKRCGRIACRSPYWNTPRKGKHGGTR